ncbi:MAG: ferredoxin:protochlorophyllide reductase (ATP-dependent) subunit B [Chloroflexi bacterium AL-W]|nr:ferredoxin:protochlorophyllide reductase (ATP-dependent) subunit B [Chloroflexi bacterium AL-N1]NOK65161.1 ferredoxin:protochlorophyllide reductase (ATP-dependent) subunit B [Chloroflexi bacterium AL-N10]NOK72573.1 ferredoxin:protochlorophyllide reductase (ATP-dependent) subunit B [Chloroflexi bacterium AL-N5]NOK79340.1 ferredoxin:protochlorophyllide reductase (ATP-dependent) subunit B [Chloroflexi bacterium AL-W]NOK87256.1 ferredoxin:protochlorophyllide reductase (ATP-dependent) subunit B [
MRLALWMYQGTAHHGVGRVANSMHGVHAVFHAPQGDDYVNPIFTMLERTPTFPQMTTSIVSGHDLARGTIRLPDTLKQVEASLHPELIIVCASCSTILLQEDLQVVADSADIDTEVLVYDANPYRMQEIVAADGLTTLLVKRYAIPQELTPHPSVNIIGPASLGFHVRSDLICLRRILATLGVQVNVVAPLGASIGDMRRLPAAWVNIAPYHELGHQAGQYLEEQFGTSTLYEAPMGVQPTLRWLRQLVEQLNEVGAKTNAPPVKLPPLTAFSLDGMSAPSSVPWFARTADMESFSSKQAFVFGNATNTVGMVKFLHDELAMQIAGAGTYLTNEADWVREQLDGYLPNDLLVTEHFQDVAQQIEELSPQLVCGTQMERHSCRKFDIPCMVIAPPTHIENHLLSYRPILGFDGADVLADTVYTTTKLGLEKHLIDMFGDAGLEYENGVSPSNTSQETDPVREQEQAVNGSPDHMTWTDEAHAMLKKVPFFVRGRVQKNTEKYALSQGYTTVTVDVLQEAKESLGG